MQLVQSGLPSDEQYPMIVGWRRPSFVSISHDCFVQGCDASILLDETDTIQSEKTAFPNVDSVRGYDVIEAAKRDVERICPGVVSCADILTLAARDASVYVGGPTWTVRLGRRDSTTANRDQANTDLPDPFSTLAELISSFGNKGLSETDMHPKTRCPQSGGDRNLGPLDLVTPNSFDNNYFKNLMQRKGLLQSDQVLFSGGSTNRLVSDYSRNPRLFASDFANAIIKMGEIPATQQNGIIRRVTRASNLSPDRLDDKVGLPDWVLNLEVPALRTSWPDINYTTVGLRRKR
ncbi:hypothetical protein DH2020_043997 [Rehmannia glutinosa]|uniref:Peroxidase n=1 Tax=Rehmannia glutinosa TaxID=99300 RepID=A0ABR0UIY4_REHGL